MWYWWIPMIFARYHEKQMKNEVGHFERQNAPSSTPSIFWNALWNLQNRFQFLKCLVVFARQVPINVAFFKMPWHGFCKAGSNQCCIFQNALAWFLQGRFQSMLHFSQCLGTVFARQILIGNMTESWYIKRKNACVYTFEQEFSPSLLHMRPIGFKSSAYYTQKWNKTWSPDLSLFPCTIY